MTARDTGQRIRQGVRQNIRSPGRAAAWPAARRARLVTVWALALLFGWPASMPWLEPAASPSGDTRTITGAGDGWIRSAEAQNRRRRRRPNRRNRGAAAPAQGDNRPAASDSAPGPTAPSLAPGPKAGNDKDKVFDLGGFDISGQLRTPQLLYFLDRAAEELDRASLERRSFIPEMVLSIDEESL